MDKEIAELRGHVKAQRAQGAPTRTRYAPEFRQRVLALAREQRAQGASIGSVARSLGLKPTTLHRWLEESKEVGLRRVVVEPVEVDSRGPGRLVVFAGPLRIEGLDVAELALLVRGLA
jgi:DNA invertase Pin-like site-specific DNA recombinase